MGNCKCDDNQFLCANRKCIPNQWACNGQNDCGDQSDESSDICKGRIFFMIITIVLIEELSNDPNRWWLILNSMIVLRCLDFECEDGYFTCSSGNCIPSTKMCDGNNDCGDNSDEGKHCKGERKDLDRESYFQWYILFHQNKFLTILLFSYKMPRKISICFYVGNILLQNWKWEQSQFWFKRMWW